MHHHKDMVIKFKMHGTSGETGLQMHELKKKYQVPNFHTSYI